MLLIKVYNITLLTIRLTKPQHKIFRLLWQKPVYAKKGKEGGMERKLGREGERERKGDLKALLADFLKLMPRK